MELNVPLLRQIAAPLPRKHATAKDDPTKRRVSRKASVSNANDMISFWNCTLLQA
jgi:hypothetical protein